MELCKRDDLRGVLAALEVVASVFELVLVWKGGMVSVGLWSACIAFGGAMEAAPTRGVISVSVGGNVSGCGIGVSTPCPTCGWVGEGAICLSVMEGTLAKVVCDGFFELLVPARPTFEWVEGAGFAGFLKGELEAARPTVLAEGVVSLLFLRFIWFL